ncbi:MAG TPA: hypothetical protein VH458_04515 [Vicinamibacterales bacterium]
MVWEFERLISHMLVELRRILEEGPARRRVAGKDVWLIDSGFWWRRFRDRARIKDLEVAILSAAWRLASPLYLIPAEQPPDPEFERFVRSDGPAWRIETATSPAAFYENEATSRFGNWCLYAAARPLQVPFPDLFRSAPATVLTFMADQRVPLVIEAFHDAAPWCVALCETALSRDTA